jgi:hypothetical protein
MISIELHLIVSYVTKEQNYEIYNSFYYRICNTLNVSIIYVFASQIITVIIDGNDNYRKNIL